ncbi:hypothetical protein EVAR_56177_1 [Eumeta japonica]|uniref:Uncharacterized protein n=1 Tax=Eumeta variegata TaxID=151549 RepID=A0A4C1ZQW1_EUMVA|nr:hypothetical protein EVAR_56177_1 [Eumeta japonica]
MKYRDCMLLERASQNNPRIPIKHYTTTGDVKGEGVRADQRRRQSEVGIRARERRLSLHLLALDVPDQVIRHANYHPELQPQNPRVRLDIRFCSHRYPLIRGRRTLSYIFPYRREPDRRKR